MKTLLATLTFLCLASPAFAFKAKPSNPQVKATATAHGSTLTWSEPATGIPAGAYVNIYRGTAAGAEGSTAINSTGIKLGTLTYEDSNVVAGAKYYYTAKLCALSPANGSEVCGGASNEASDTIPLLAGDFPILGGFSASGH